MSDQNDRPLTPKTRSGTPNQSLVSQKTHWLSCVQKLFSNSEGASLVSVAIQLYENGKLLFANNNAATANQAQHEALKNAGNFALQLLSDRIGRAQCYLSHIHLLLSSNESEFLKCLTPLSTQSGNLSCKCVLTSQTVTPHLSFCKGIHLKRSNENNNSVINGHSDQNNINKRKFNLCCAKFLLSAQIHRLFSLIEYQILHSSVQLTEEWVKRSQSVLQNQIDRKSMKNPILFTSNFTIGLFVEGQNLPFVTSELLQLDALIKRQQQFITQARKMFEQISTEISQISMKKLSSDVQTQIQSNESFNGLVNSIPNTSDFNQSKLIELINQLQSIVVQSNELRLICDETKIAKILIKEIQNLQFNQSNYPLSVKMEMS